MRSTGRTFYIVKFLALCLILTVAVPVFCAGGLMMAQHGKWGYFSFQLAAAVYGVTAVTHGLITELPIRRRIERLEAILRNIDKYGPSGPT
jgi:hypothetical protein